MATFTSRISDLIDTPYTALSGKDGVLTSAVSEIADMVSPLLLLKYAVNPLDLDGTTVQHAIEGKKVLLVTRNDGSIDRESKEITISQFAQAQDAASIYLATAFSPVHCLITDAGTTTLKIFPLTTASGGKIYYFEYPLPTVNLYEDESITGFPRELEHSVVLRTSIKLLQAYVGDAVQQDEDAELQQQINAQITGLQSEFKDEIGRFIQGGPE